MSLAKLDNLTIAFRGPPLLDGVNAVIERGDRIGLLGRNGAGKSTLMKILAGEVPPDSGTCTLAAGGHVERLIQEVPEQIPGTIAQTLRSGWRESGEGSEVWRADALLDQLLTDMRLEGDRQVSDLSAGFKRRVLLGRTVMARPDLLLLDEPTNHLDLASIEWLEDFLSRWPATLLFVTHDREFLRRVATRIMEIDRGRLFDWSCGYDDFLHRKEEALAAEEKQNALFDKRLAEEERWIRQGIKARRTRNEGRVRALKTMRNERSERREHEGVADLQLQEAERSGQLVAKADGVSFSYGDHLVFADLTTTVMRGDKIGVIGPNGAGKTTLLRVLLGEAPPTCGTVRLGTNLKIAYFDQLRGQLDPEQTPEKLVADGYDTVQVSGATRHALGYLKDFLFSAERARTQVKHLSGGERNRLLLAKLFTKPANVIVLDEPTNDLDAETLEMLESRLVDYSGTLLVVSHDRAFLNNVVTSTLVFEPAGVREYVGGYDDWLRQRQSASAQQPIATKDKRASATTAGEPNGDPNGEPTSEPARPRKLAYKEQRELASLPARIEKLESELAELHAQMADPTFYKQPAEVIAAAQRQAAQLQAELDTAYVRWEELEAV